MKTKMLALFAALVLSVALAGTAYAAWTATINVTGSVSTGNVAVQVIDVSDSSPQISATWGTTSFDVVVANVYPGWSGQVQVTVKNTGSLPVTLGTVQLGESGSSTLDDYLNIGVSGLPTGEIAPDATAVALVTLSVDNNNAVPQSATASYSGTVTFNGP